MENRRGGEFIAGIIVFFVILFVYTKLAGPISFTIHNINTSTADVFQSQGTGKASAAPDEAVITLGITAQGTTVEQVQNQANQAANKIINALKEQGIKEDKIKTTNYFLNPNYSFSGDNQKITGYSITQNFEVEAPISKTNQIIDSATKAGANTVGNVLFKLNDKKQQELKNQARKEAVDNAKASAQGLANAAGVKLGKIINVTEISNGGVIPIAFTAAAKATDQEGAMILEAPQREITNITPGESNIEVTVTLTYQTN